MKIRRQTLSELPYDPRVHGIRQSTLNKWLICREAARLSTCQCWRRIGLKEPTTYGSIMHECIKIANKNHSGISLGEIEELVPSIVDEAVNTFKKEFKTLTTQDKDMIEKSASLIIYFFQEYLNRWWSIDSKRHWVKIEDKFSVPFKMSDGETVYLTGTYDGAYKSKTSDELWLFETKNKRTWDSEKLSCILPYDIQVAIYLTALKRCEKLSPVGCDYNILKRPGEKIKKNESIKAFAERVSDAMRADPSKYFERINMKFTRSELLTMEERTVALVTEYYHWWKNIGCKPTKDPLMNTGACDLPQRTCDMMPICMSNDTQLFERITHKSANAP